MRYIETIKLPSRETICNYWYSNTYPWNIFLKNEFEWVNLKDITIFYGNNGSGKSTLLNLIGEKIEAFRTTKVFKDFIYDRITGAEIHFFEDFVKEMSIKMSKDDGGDYLKLPKTIKLITSDDIFKKIENRTDYNNKTLDMIASKRDEYSEIKYNSSDFRANSSNYDDLVKIIDSRRLSKTKFSKKYSVPKEQMQSNGETALDFFDKAFEKGGIYLLDEPENCLSPLFQIELMKIIEEASKYYDCQFIICSHSPLILSLDGACIYNMDLVPVMPQKWEELENVRIYYDFFKIKNGKFEK